MSATTSQDVLRPGPSGPQALLTRAAMACVPFGLGALRRVRPICRFGGAYVVTLHDDVREVFLEDGKFGVVYDANLQVITGGEPFLLGLPDAPAYRSQLRAMQRVCLEHDLKALGDRAEDMAEAVVAASGGRLDVVSMVRRVTFDVVASYFGVPEPRQGRLDVWATRLFEFQFAGSPKDVALRAEVDEIAPAFRDHIDGEIKRRKAASVDADDVLGRCLRLQAEGEQGYDDAQIRTALLCMVVGGPPQPPMVVPQAMEQLLRRPAALAAAREAASGDDDSLYAILIEAMRFDPLAPGLPRVATRDCVLAAGTERATKVQKGATVIAAFASAMMDGRRVPDPGAFRAGRLPYEYVHFGLGMHQCFGRHVNRAILHRMLKPLLRRPALARAEGRDGRLRKRGIFADRLVVQYR